jgi:hypothetical protein
VTAPVLVADFVLGGARPAPVELVEAAVARGASFVAAAIAEDDDDALVAEVDGHRVGGLARLAALALRHQLGLLLRLHDTTAIDGLAQALGAEKDASAAPRLRERLLVVVPGERVGRRLRMEAPQFPSAYELPSSGDTILTRWLPVNVRRAAADADDLVVPWGRLDPARLASRIAPDLARRGARLWLSDVPETEVDRATAVGAAGVIVRWSLRGELPGT